MLQRIKSGLEVTWRRCCIVSRASWKLLEEDVASCNVTMLQHLGNAGEEPYYTPQTPSPKPPPEPPQKKRKHLLQKWQQSRPGRGAATENNCQLVGIMSMQYLQVTQATSMTQRVFSSLPLKFHVNVWLLCTTYKIFLYLSLLASRHFRAMRQNPRLEPPASDRHNWAWSMHCHCFSPFLPWQSAQTYQLQSWQGRSSRSGSSAGVRCSEWMQLWASASQPKATGLGFSASAPSPALSFFLAAWPMQRRCQLSRDVGTCSEFRGQLQCFMNVWRQLDRINSQTQPSEP